MKKVIILIDGANLFYTLKNLGLIEKDINWDNVFKFLIDATKEELVRTYWFRPQKILDTYYTHNNVRNAICQKKYKPHFADYRKVPPTAPNDIITKIEEEAKLVEDWLKKEKKKFAEIEYNYDDLSLSYQNIEIVKSGVVKVDPFKQEYIGEKGVDIALAVKMISLSVRKNCDKIILVSGDLDYAEAIRFVKDNMTKIHIVKIHKGVPPKNKSVSRDLAVLADGIINIYEVDIKSNFLV